MIRSLDHWGKAGETSEFVQGRAVGITLGNFDGVHLGHQALFARLEEELAAKYAGTPKTKVLFTFHPLPKQFFAKKSEDVESGAATFGLVTFREKYQLVQKADFDLLVTMHFNQSFSELSPEEFVERCVVVPFRPKIVVVGDDWAFGKGRAGNVQLLKAFGRKNGFDVSVVDAQLEGGERISTSYIKRLLAVGNVSDVPAVLGRPFSISGRVQRGDKRGRTLGFATANVVARNQNLPLDGVYATLVSLRGIKYQAVTNIGLRPTFGGKRRLVESHLLGQCPKSFYSERITVEFLQLIRPEQKFSSGEDLRQQIEHDIVVAQNIFSQLK